MIMDGNRRWVKEHTLSTIGRHGKEGVDALRTAAHFCLKKGISYLSVFMLSLENGGRRSQTELNEIFAMTIETCTKDAKDLAEHGISIRFIGDRSLFPEHVKPAIEYIEHYTAHCTKLCLNLLFFYGARQEMVSAVQQIAHKVSAGLLDLHEVNEAVISDHLWTAQIPDPDLVVRTGSVGTTRLSNFLLYQASYSEWRFLDIYWPELSEKHLEECWDYFYKGARRNFGR
jgi:undecaprenyl diphosphate synthase